jgi:DNA-binding transcriptional ArsR family regulator
VSQLTLNRTVLERLALRFRALAEPNRLLILAVLVGGERTVTELAVVTGLGQANLSKHLGQLHREGFVGRRKEGMHTYYRVTDDDVFQICERMCGRIERDAEELAALMHPHGTHV